MVGFHSSNVDKLNLFIDSKKSVVVACGLRILPTAGESEKQVVSSGAPHTAITRLFGEAHQW